MSISYNRLWKLIIDKNINKFKLRTQADISSNAMAKLGKNESVQVEALVKICSCLGCTIFRTLKLLRYDLITIIGGTNRG